MAAVPASSSPQRWLVPVIIVVLSLMVGGGLLARELYRVPDQTPAAILAPVTTGSRAPEQQPGPATVELTPDAAGHPEHELIKQLLQTYFYSINNRDYDAWRTAVTKARLQGKTQRAWLNDFQSTKDGSVLVYRIEAVTQSALRVLVGFTSVQSPDDAPPELPGASCVQWKLSLPVTMESGTWKVDAVAGYSPPEATKC